MAAPETLTLVVPSLPAVGSAILLLCGLCAAWGRLTKSIGVLEKQIDDKVIPQLTEMGQRIAAMEPLVSMWQNQVSARHSPRQLNDNGKSILEKSGIKEIVEKEKSKFLEIVKAEKPTNAYDADLYIFNAMVNMQRHCPQYMDALKNWSFNAGIDLQVVLFVGSIYLRDWMFPELGFSLTDLDKAKPAPSSDNK